MSPATNNRLMRNYLPSHVLLPLRSDAVCARYAACARSQPTHQLLYEVASVNNGSIPFKFGSEKTPPGGAADILGVNPGNASHRSGPYPPRPSHRLSVPPPLNHTLLSPANHASAACSPFCTLGGSDASRSIRTTMLRGAMESTPHGLARPWRSRRWLLAPLACYGSPPTLLTTSTYHRAMIHDRENGAEGVWQRPR